MKRKLPAALSEGETAVLLAVSEGNNDMGNYWAGSVAHLKRRGFVFYGRIAGQCVVYLTPAGFKSAWKLALHSD